VISELNGSSRSTLLRVLVARHIRDGQPVGSRTLHEEAGLPLSPGDDPQRHVRSRGAWFPAFAAHLGGARAHGAGYRFFVDSLLQVRQLDEDAWRRCAASCDPDRSSADLVQTASSLLSAISSQAGVVTVPRPSRQPLRQVEFLPLSGDRVLAILVVNQREVQNRIIHTRRVFSEEELRDAAALINAALRRATSSRDIQGRWRRKSWRRAAASMITSRRRSTWRSRRWTPTTAEDCLIVGESRLLEGASAGAAREPARAFRSL
jgi:heat-inducible transcriptional repressor